MDAGGGPGDRFAQRGQVVAVIDDVEHGGDMQRRQVRARRLIGAQIGMGRRARHTARVGRQGLRRHAVAVEIERVDPADRAAGDRVLQVRRQGDGAAEPTIAIRLTAQRVQGREDMGQGQPLIGKHLRHAAVDGHRAGDVQRALGQKGGARGEGDRAGQDAVIQPADRLEQRDDPVETVRHIRLSGDDQ
jgi:hypothetical protein